MIKKVNDDLTLLFDEYKILHSEDKAEEPELVVAIRMRRSLWIFKRVMGCAREEIGGGLSEGRSGGGARTGWSTRYSATQWR
jgi:hypothetical protein